MKVYHLSEAGLAELRRWLSTPLPEQDTREPLLIQLFFGGQLTDAELLKVLEHEVEQAEANLAFFTNIYRALLERPRDGGDARAVFLRALTLEYGLAAQRALLHWLRGAIERLQTQDYSPAPLPDLTGDLS
jgi:PadR family transcriptional regulator, regulatory protein AphA